MTGISDIDLPNGQTYTFAYDDPYGMVSRITFPDGGYVNYTWALFEQRLMEYSTE